MIRYDLVCGEGHGFDGWFRDSGAFDAQAAHLACPVCGSHSVSKAIMAPSLGRRREPAPAAGPLEKEAALREAVRRLRRHVVENSDYVGERFPEEVRRIHYDEAPARGLYGEASPDEAKALVDEGIAVLPLPKLPEEAN